MEIRPHIWPQMVPPLLNSMTQPTTIELSIYQVEYTHHVNVGPQLTPLPHPSQIVCAASAVSTYKVRPQKPSAGTLNKVYRYIEDVCGIWISRDWVTNGAGKALGLWGVCHGSSLALHLLKPCLHL